MTRLPDWCTELLPAADQVHAVAGRIWSLTPGLSLADAGRDLPSEGYDAVAASRGYLRTAWGLDPVDQRSFARAALASRRGPMLDAACGGLALTADLYATARRPLLLVDRSLPVLRLAEERLARRGDVVLLHAELDRLELARGSVSTVACLGVLHLVDDAPGLVARLTGWVRPGGTVYLSSLTTGRRGSDALLRLVRRTGELAEPRTSQQVVAAAGLSGARVVRRGAMTYVDGVVPARA